jgi:hypothetical protein
LIDELGNEDIVCSLERVVQEFDREIGPYALQLIQMLMSVFNKVMSKENSEDAELCAGMQAIRTIATVLYSLSEVPELIPQVEPILTGLIDLGLSPQGLEVIEDVLEIISCCISENPNGISETMWPVLPKMVHAFLDHAGDCLSNMLGPFEIYITRDPAGFVQRSGLSFAYSIAEHILVRSDHRSTDIKYACKILEYVLLFCQGLPVEFVSSISEMITSKLSSVSDIPQVSMGSKLALAHTLSCLILIDSGRFLSMPVQLLDDWTTYSREQSSNRSRKYFVLAASQILQHHKSSVLMSACESILSELERDSYREGAVEGILCEEEGSSSKFLDIPSDQDFCGEEDDAGLAEYLRYVDEEEEEPVVYDDEDRVVYDRVDVFSVYHRSINC